MDAIVTHESADFDALAACVAAQRLYPGSVIVLGRMVSADVRDFLALHKDRFLHLRVNDIDQNQIDRLVIVDVRRTSRLGAFDRLLERIRQGDPTLTVHVWDHHGPSDDDVPAAEAHVEPVGSATTLLIEEIRRRSLTVDPVEATLLALGIHADTGSLCFGTATARDAQALAWLMEGGANSRAIERYLDPPLSHAQRRALVQVLEQSEVRSVAGYRIGTCVLRADTRCPGLDVVTSRGRALLGLAAFVVIYEIQGKGVDVVARSMTPEIDVGAWASELGGGGHPSAASASAKGLDADEALARVEAALAANPPRPRSVADLMTAPVHAVRPDLPLEDLARCLRAWGHTGAPVVADGRLVGIVSRRDVDKARDQGALHLPVSGRMTQKVHTIGVDASVLEALERMQANDIGRLPVVDGERLVGIVTRSDVLGVLYE